MFLRIDLRLRTATVPDGTGYVLRVQSPRRVRVHRRRTAEAWNPCVPGPFTDHVCRQRSI